jgi:hypothetical protein
MNRKLKQVVARASRANKSLFQGSSSSSSRREAMLRCAHGEEGRRSITFQRSDDEEEEQGAEEEQGGEEEWRGEEAENVGEGPNEEEAELERVPRQTRRIHMVVPPIAPAQEDDRVLIRPLGDQ